MRTLKTVKRKKDEEKSRSFSVRLLGFLARESFLAPPQTKLKKDIHFPIYVAYTGSEQELQPFTANFRASRLAEISYYSLQIPKKVKYRWVHHRLGGASVTVAYLPEFFHLETDGRTDPLCRFVFAPPTWWVDEQAELLRSDFGDEARDAARAALFAAYLDRRAALPLLADLKFHLQLYRAALEADWLSELSGSSPYDLGLWGEIHPEWGVEAPLCVAASKTQIEHFLVTQTQTFYKEEIANGQTRIPTTRRVLPFPQGPAEQLCFDFALGAESA